MSKNTCRDSKCCGSCDGQNLQEIVDSYKKNRRDNYHCYHNEFKKHAKWSTAADAESLILGKHPNHPEVNTHQRRLYKRARRQFASALVENRSRIGKAKDFDSLINTLAMAAGSGIGSLAIYDTALRIGKALNLRPKNVYLHAGPLVSAKHLKLKIHCEYVNKIAIRKLRDPYEHPEFQSMKEEEIEDLLCVCKSAILNLQPIRSYG